MLTPMSGIRSPSFSAARSLGKKLKRKQTVLTGLNGINRLDRMKPVNILHGSANHRRLTGELKENSIPLGRSDNDNTFFPGDFLYFSLHGERLLRHLCSIIPLVASGDTSRIQQEKHTKKQPQKSSPAMPVTNHGPQQQILFFGKSH